VSEKILTKRADASRMIVLLSALVIPARHRYRSLTAELLSGTFRDRGSRDGGGRKPLAAHRPFMTRNFARYEQFLRIYALYDILLNSRQPLDDPTLIGRIRERLGLSTLSPRTLHRDCEFLVACGYPIDRTQMVGDRRQGWLLNKEAAARKFPGELPTILELVAFNVARDLLRTFEGTILWTGIESLRSKIERDLPPELVAQVSDARKVFHVETVDATKYAARPRLLSALSTAITDCREIEVESRAGETVTSRRIQPTMLVVRLPKVQLLGWSVPTDAEDPHVIIDIEKIDKVTTLDSTFVPRPIDPETFRDGSEGVG
jgi:predicted DNA-binding transcriptional regulator YafY